MRDRNDHRERVLDAMVELRDQQVALLLIVPRFSNPLLDELVSAHVRSLMPAAFFLATFK